MGKDEDVFYQALHGFSALNDESLLLMTKRRRNTSWTNKPKPAHSYFHLVQRCSGRAYHSLEKTGTLLSVIDIFKGTAWTKSTQVDQSSDFLINSHLFDYDQAIKGNSRTRGLILETSSWFQLGRSGWSYKSECGEGGSNWCHTLSRICPPALQE